ncbi:MAG: glutamate-ammonia-ligase adenylyltransferase, partial [Alphaproteobacteria bacterium]
LAANKGRALDTGVFDVKLGRGGIRDIELFAQTQQLILGGRDKALRVRPTVDALAALRAAGRVETDAETSLVDSYRLYRNVEHRIQMLADEQTHRTPDDADGQGRLAALAGFDSWAALADPLGSLIFTGVENNPETLATLSQLGFVDPDAVSDAVRGWHHGRIRATRSERARELLTAIMPRLLRAIADSGEPDAAFARFCDFLAGLPSGVTVLSLFQAQPRLLTDLADVLGLAPLMADSLARRPALLDAMVDNAFVRPIAQDAPGARRAALARLIAETDGFEAAINAARRFHREEALRIGLQTLQGRATAADAGAAHADLAEACVTELADVAIAEVSRLHGPPPGAYVVLALGKFGGRELAAGSDLDVMVVFDAAEGAESTGARPLSANEYFIKVTQRLISALSAPTEEGLLYDVDMQLRPSGSKGPVAVRLSGFAHYYAEEAWTWELLALTRVRPVAGDEALARKAMAAVAAVIAHPRKPEAVLSDSADMRARMDRERPGRGLWDLKLQPGGLVDIEFVAQALSIGAVAHANTGAALAALKADGRLNGPDADLLSAAWTVYSDLQQVLRICVDDLFDPARAPERLKALLARGGHAQDFAVLEARLAGTMTAVRAAYLRAVSGGGDGTSQDSR